MGKGIHRITIDGVQGWFFPDGFHGTPPMSMCEKCGYLLEAERHYSALCNMVNRAGHGISGVTCGTDGYDEENDSVIRRMRRKDFTIASRLMS